MRITSIISDKGGDTKTTTTNAIATGINHLYADKNTLAITNEPSGHLPFFYGLNSDNYPTTYHIANKDITFSETIQQTDRGDIINGNHTVNLMDGLPSTQEEKIKLYSLIKDGLSMPAMGDRYSHCFIDCKPLTNGILTIQSLVASTDVVIPMKASALSVKSLLILHKGIMEVRASYNPHIKIAGILITRYRNTTVEKTHIENLKMWAKLNDTKVYNTMIPDGVGIEEAQGLSQNIYTFKYERGKDKPANAYAEFIKEYLAEER